MTVGCCGCRDGPGEDEQEGGEGQGGQQQRSVADLITSTMYGRFGRVERYRHTDTIVFLGTALLVSYALVMIVQHAGQPQTCDIAKPLYELPKDFQNLLRNNAAKWRCDTGEDYDLVFSLELGQFLFESSNSSLTRIRPQTCTVEPNNLEVGGNVPTSCPDWPHCDSLEKYIWDKNCHLELPPSRSPHRMVWGWYFSLTSLILAGCLLFILIFKVADCCCGGKREGIAVIV